MAEIVYSGWYTSIQDSGRFGHRDIGVPVSGVMDPVPMRFINGILGNPRGTAVLEITLRGPMLRFTSAGTICLGGPPMEADIDGNPLERYRSYAVGAGSVLRIGAVSEGARGYLGFGGGIVVPEVLGSRSQLAYLTGSRRLRAGDRIGLGLSSPSAAIHGAVHSAYWKTLDLECSPGPEFALLPKELQASLHEHILTVGPAHDRMAYRMDTVFHGHGTEVATSATLPGTVQLPPSGKPIVLMRDAQTTGGYPRILQLTPQAQAILAQKSGGDLVRFRLSDPKSRAKRWTSL